VGKPDVTPYAASSAVGNVTAMVMPAALFRGDRKLAIWRFEHGDPAVGE
jgi:hypothetical protein